MAKDQASLVKNGLSSLSLPAPKESVAQLAYQYYVERGCEHGHDQEDWLRAEATVQQKKSK